MEIMEIHIEQMRNFSIEFAFAVLFLFYRKIENGTTIDSENICGMAKNTIHEHLFTWS